MSSNMVDEAQAAADFDWDAMEADDVDDEQQHDEPADEVIDDEAMEDADLDGDQEQEQDDEEKVSQGITCYHRLVCYESLWEVQGTHPRYLMIFSRSIQIFLPGGTMEDDEELVSDATAYFVQAEVCSVFALF